MAERYVLATGDVGVDRLRVVDRVHGADTRDFLQEHLRSGMQVAEIGCGVGIVAAWIAEQVRPAGRVTALDASSEQIAAAHNICGNRAGDCVKFQTANAYATGLSSNSFDLVYSRFMLMHVQDPARALQEMYRILKPGGMLAIEDGDFTTPFCWPPSEAYDRCFELYRTAGGQHGEDFLIGRKLYTLVGEVGFTNRNARLVQPVLTDDIEAKRLPRWTLEETACTLTEAALAAQSEIDGICTELSVLEERSDTLFAMARITQIDAEKPIRRS